MKPSTRTDPEKILAYIVDQIVSGLDKKSSYLKNINEVSKVHIAISRLEKSQQYEEVYASVMNDNNMLLKAKAQKARLQYVNLINKNLDLAESVVDSVKEGTVKDKGIAIRLMNETIGAMSIVDGPTQAQAPGALNKGSVVQ